MRILMTGASGSGKTTFAGRLGAILGIPHTEMDSLHWGENWTPRPSFEADVDELAAQDSWITEWQYSQVRERLLERADTVIYLHYPRWFVEQRVIRRTLHRAVTREKLWAGNTEPPLWSVFTDPENMIRYTWSSYPKYEPLMAEARRNHPDKRYIEFRTPREAEKFLQAVRLRGNI